MRRLQVTVPASDETRSGTIAVAGVSIDFLQKPDHVIGSLWVSSTACWPVTAGQYAPLACSIHVSEATNPFSTGIRASVDLRTVGLSANRELAYCYGCGGGYDDLDLTVPAGTPAANYTIWFWATGAQGRTSELKSATLTVKAP